MNDKIIVRGAREHNLRNLDVDIPKNKITVLTGISGSGKSSLAFDTIYAEGQRRYVESLSAYARQFLGMMSKPDVDSIEGLSPAISIEQKSASNNPRSTVGTITEIFDYMRLLYARIGVPHCPICGKQISSTTVDAIVTAILSEKPGTRIQILSPVIEGKKGQYEKMFEDFQRQGFSRVRVDGDLYEVGAEIRLEKNSKHTIEVVVDRLSIDETQKQRVYDAVSTAVKLSKGGVIVLVGSGTEKRFSTQNACIEHGISLGELEPRMFSFNSPFGACPECHGLGIKLEFDENLIVPDRTKSIIEGAIAPWGDNPQNYRLQALAQVAKHYGFDLYTPYLKLPKKFQNVIMFGTEDPIAFKYQAKSGNANWSYVGGFEGAVHQLERLYRETESEDRRADMEQYMRETPCPKCKGNRLKDESLAVKIGGKNIIESTDQSIGRCLEFFDSLKLSAYEQEVAKMVLKEIKERLLFLHEVGLDYVTLSRSAGTLSGGESQRIRLATQIGSNLSGVLYILDEPSIGLHQRDNAKLIATLRRLRDLGNTVLVVEHDEETMLAADWIVEIGPGAGKHGGLVVASGTPLQIKQNKDSLTGQYLSGVKYIEVPKSRRRWSKTVDVIGATGNNLKDIDVKFPLGVFTCVTGVSGSGKSTLVQETLQSGLHKHIYGTSEEVQPHEAINGIDIIDKVISIDQQPIGRTPRSNPATYIGVFTAIRELFAQTQDARVRGFGPGRFSFNVTEGRCSECDGDGVKKIEMHFLPDIFVTCESCKGKRYDSATLEIEYDGKNIADILDMTVEEASLFFAKIPQIRNKLNTLVEVGLGYIKLGQPATTLSGGEAQRVKLSSELSKRDTGNTLYVLDEPTTGLHFEDIKKLLSVLSKLVDKGNTVIVIEHNLDVIKTADWIIDMGPEGGEYGGRLIAQGTPEDVAKEKNSFTGQYLKKVLG